MTAVLGLKPGHDGSFAFLHDGELVYSLEGEKDAFERYGPVTAGLMVEALTLAPSWPDVIATGGWHKLLPGLLSGTGAGYLGLNVGKFERVLIAGRRSLTYSSSHERSHIFSGVALSPFDPTEEIAILVWEGVIGAFYKWSDRGASIRRIPVLDQPGARYSALFGLAEPTFADAGSFPPSEYAGKLMALVAFADGREPTKDSKDVVDSLLSARSLYPFDKARYRQSPLHNCGVQDPEIARAARYLSDELFARFWLVAEAEFTPGLPLVINGGCGLNCEWNSAWSASGLFREVFVPPCANDTGSALGTAADAWVQMGGSGSLVWNVYRGAAFVQDLNPTEHGWTERPLDDHDLSGALDAGAIVAWVQGRCEIGPRALGHRSLLASAERPDSRERLNEIKLREAYRPIAPVCLEADLGIWFDRSDPDPWMLTFRRVREARRVPSITHVDGSARVQSVSADSCPALHRLLTAHRRRTGVGLLCNTSLNFNGTGFINRSSELLHYCDWTGIDHVVIGDRWFRKDHRGIRARDAFERPARGRQI